MSSDVIVIQGDVLIKAGELEALADNLDAAGTVSCGPGETHELIRKWKWNCAVNAEALRAELKHVARQQQVIVSQSIPGMDDYEDALEELIEKYADRNPDGTPILEHKDGAVSYQLARKARRKMEAEKKLIDAEHEETIRARDEAVAAVSALYDTTRTVRLRLWPYSRLPVKLSGGYMHALAPVLHGVPEG